MIFGAGANIKCFKHVPVIIQPCKEIKELEILFIKMKNLKENLKSLEDFKGILKVCKGMLNTKTGIIDPKNTNSRSCYAPC